ncbi:MAG: serine/threonine-protein phosphatase [Polyangiaceae bacterium]|nr:serine/threonine-protein phosphatase [Polyangiaceae bacterium]
MVSLEDTTPTQRSIVSLPFVPIPSQFQVHGVTHCGRVRQSNEDALGYSDTFGLALVADGVGVGSGGGRAARLAVRTLTRALPAECAELGKPHPWTEHHSKQALLCALWRVQARIATDAGALGLPKMATTLTTVWCVGSSVLIGHVGDSRAYRLRGGTFQQLTRDHTILGDLQRDFSVITEEMKTKYAHVLNRAFSARREWVEPDITIEPWQAGDVFLACTDGLTGVVGDREIAAVLGDVPLEKAPGVLVDLANAAGGRDNVAVVVARVG